MSTFFLRFFLLLWLAGASYVPGHAQRIGSLDRDFGDQGSLILGPAHVFGGTGLLRANAEGWIISGSADHAYLGGASLLALQSDGSLRPSFGEAGRRYLNTGGQVRDLLPLPEGGYLATGRHGDHLWVMRLDAQGQADSSFGQAGHVVVELGGESEGVKVLCDPSGHIWVAGNSLRPDTHEQWLVAVRLRPDGRLDRQFGHGGSRLLRIHGQESCRDAQLDGRGGLILGAETRPGRFSQFAALRLDATGHPDAHWGQGGSITLWPGGENAYLQHLTVLPGGDLLLAGHAKTDQSRQRFDLILYRLDTLGRPDARMGRGGYRRLDLGGNAYLQSLAIQADGLLLLGGTLHYRPYLLRVDAWGRRDYTFGQGGLCQLADWGGNSQDRVLGIGLDAQGQILMAGLWDNALHLVRLQGNPALAGLPVAAAHTGSQRAAATGWEAHWNLPNGKMFWVQGQPKPATEAPAGFQLVESSLLIRLGQQTLALAEAGNALHLYLNGQYAGNRPRLLWEARRQALAGK